MKLTIRTLPRDDGQTSVVLYQTPCRPEDPEVLGVFADAREARNFVIRQAQVLHLSSGEAFVGGEVTATLGERAGAKAELELDDAFVPRLVTES